MTPTIEPPPSISRRSTPWARVLVAFLVGVIAVGALGVGALYAYDQQFAGRVLPGVHVGDVDLSGLTSAAATEALNVRFADDTAGSALITTPAGERTIGFAEVGRAPDTNAMVQAALLTGRQQAGVGQLVGTAQTALRGVTLTPALTFDRDKLAAAVLAIAKTIDIAPVEATVALAEDSSFVVTASADGRVLDQDALLATLSEALLALGTSGELRLDARMTVARPVVDTAGATAARDTGDRMVQDLVFTDGDRSWTIKEASLRPLVSFAKTVDGGLVPVVDIERLDPLLAPIAKDLAVKPKNATYLTDKDGEIVGVQASEEGRGLNVSETRGLIIDTLLERLDGTTTGALAPVVTTMSPTLSSAEAEKFAPLMQKISTWTTYFPISEKNGNGANIWIPSSIINGYVVGPGETFDFWDAVGPVTREAGYKDGGAIINGKTEPQGALAGGICSCSTTLFNAALRAGFEMGARRNHYYYIDRYPLGLDATVFISASGTRQTMSWTNDTPYPVLIRGINTRKGSAGYVTFTLYSVPTGRLVKFSEPVVEDIQVATDTTEYTDTLPAGTEERIEYPVDGKKVWVTRTVTVDGTVLHQETYYSNYARITGVTLIGTAGATPTPSPTPAPTP